MSIEQTLSIIKPDATSRNITGQVNSIIEKSGLKIIGQKRIKLTEETAGKFYEVHKERPFFKDLVSFMVSGPVVVQVLQGENAVSLYRKVMGATNPQEADLGTIRKEFALSIEANSVHGSDSIENAKKEISFFFSETEIFED
jgi:nucleoside-diphosphate kinase